MYVENCIICADAGHTVPATIWTGYVRRGADEIIAGACPDHREALSELPHRPEISKITCCVGAWIPAYGVTSRAGKPKARTETGSELTSRQD